MERVNLLTSRLHTIEPIIITKTITDSEISSVSLHTAESFYSNELQWDALKYIRSISLDFQSNDKNAISTWIQDLITKVPEYLYYLAEEDFEFTLKLLIQYEHSLFFGTNNDLRRFILNSIRQIAANDDELVPLVNQVIKEIFTYPLKENDHVELKNNNVLNTNFNYHYNVDRVYRIGGNPR